MARTKTKWRFFFPKSHYVAYITKIPERIYGDWPYPEPNHFLIGTDTVQLILFMQGVPYSEDNIQEGDSLILLLSCIIAWAKMVQTFRKVPWEHEFYKLRKVSVFLKIYDGYTWRVLLGGNSARSKHGNNSAVMLWNFRRRIVYHTLNEVLKIFTLFASNTSARWACSMSWIGWGSLMFSPYILTE